MGCDSSENPMIMVSLVSKKKKMIMVSVGPNNLWPWLICSLGPKARAKEGYSPGSVIQVQNSFGTQPRMIQSSACPRYHWKKGQKRYRSSLKKSKISRSTKKDTLEGTTTKESCPYCHSILCTWQSHTFQLLQPPPTILDMGWWDKYQSWKSRSYTWTKDKEHMRV